MAARASVAAAVPPGRPYPRGRPAPRRPCLPRSQGFPRWTQRRRPPSRRGIPAAAPQLHPRRHPRWRWRWHWRLRADPWARALTAHPNSAPARPAGATRGKRGQGYCLRLPGRPDLPTTPAASACCPPPGRPVAPWAPPAASEQPPSVVAAVEAAAPVPAAGERVQRREAAAGEPTQRPEAPAPDPVAVAPAEVPRARPTAVLAELGAALERGRVAVAAHPRARSYRPHSDCSADTRQAACSRW